MTLFALIDKTDKFCRECGYPGGEQSDTDPPLNAGDTALLVVRVVATEDEDGVRVSVPVNTIPSYDLLWVERRWLKRVGV